jgi:ParB-like chromosome segregation protein Spo0J
LDQQRARNEAEPALPPDSSQADADPQRVPIGLLRVAGSPRQNGEDPEHSRMLSQIEGPLPPIVVHRFTMRVIDGMHRLRAARLRGDETIEVRFFDGTEQEAFVLAVRANIAHGLPLSLADRMAAAEHIISTNPTWSDRTIAAAAGLGARTVGNLRRRLGTGDGDRVRVGRDGRVRPVDHTEGRLRASEFITNRPHASLREIARHAGVSPSTARDVRRRMQRGEDPLAQTRTAERRVAAAEPVRSDDSAEPAPPSERDLVELIEGLQRDPALRFTDSGRFVLRWIAGHVIQSDEWREVVAKVPPHCGYIIADLARMCAEQWQHLAQDLERE